MHNSLLYPLRLQSILSQVFLCKNAHKAENVKKYEWFCEWQIGVLNWIKTFVKLFFYLTKCKYIKHNLRIKHDVQNTTSNITIRHLHSLACPSVFVFSFSDLWMPFAENIKLSTNISIFLLNHK